MSLVPVTASSRKVVCFYHIRTYDGKNTKFSRAAAVKGEKYAKEKKKSLSDDRRMKFNSFFRVIETYYEYLKFSFEGNSGRILRRWLRNDRLLPLWLIKSFSRSLKKDREMSVGGILKVVCDLAVRFSTNDNESISTHRRVRRSVNCVNTFKNIAFDKNLDFFWLFTSKGRKGFAIVSHIAIISRLFPFACQASWCVKEIST